MTQRSTRRRSSTTGTPPSLRLESESTGDAPPVFFSLTIRLRHAPPVDPRVREHPNILDSESHNVLIALPVHEVGQETLVEEPFAPETARNFADLCNHFLANQQHPSVGLDGRNGIDVQGLQDIRDRLFHHLVFEHAAAYLKEVYIGDADSLSPADRAILCERFHRFLNKVQRINTAEFKNLDDWLLRAHFAVYAWNAAPVDGTNVIRSVAAIGRDFPFPIDTNTEEIVPRDGDTLAEQTLDFIHAAAPLIAQQRMLLDILINERREHHRALKNATRNPTAFHPGELVIVRKQVQTRRGAPPAKLSIRARGPYRVIEVIRPGTYKLQRIPFRQGDGRPGRFYNESGARMEKLPSPLVLHKSTDGMDSRLATFTHARSSHPLENSIGAIDFGTYTKAHTNRPFAYDRVEELLGNIEPTDSDDELDPPPPETLEPVPEPIQEDEAPATFDNDATIDTPEVVAETEQVPKRRRTTHSVPAKFREQNHNRRQTRAQRAATLAELIEASTHRLFFIRDDTAHTTPRLIAPWALVQVDMDETDPIAAKQLGIYVVRWYTAHPDDLRYRPPSQCRYWPRIHAITESSAYGTQFHVKPTKTEAYLREHGASRAWYANEVNLLDNSIFGPFNFRRPATPTAENHTIAETHWKTLTQRSPSFSVDSDNVFACRETH
jgi:hypothetical protein